MTQKELNIMEKTAISTLIAVSAVVYIAAFAIAGSFGDSLLMGGLAVTGAVLAFLFFGLKKL